MTVPLLAICGFASYKRGNEMRRRIVLLVQTEPGIPLVRAARILGIKSNTLHFHVQKLVSSEALHTATEGRAIHLFPPATPVSEQPWRKALAHPQAKAIAAIIIAQGIAGIQDVSDLRCQSRKVVRRHMLRMAKAGLLERRPGLHGKFLPSDILIAALEEPGVLGEDCMEDEDQEPASNGPARSSVAP